MRTANGGSARSTVWSVGLMSSALSSTETVTTATSGRSRTIFVSSASSGISSRHGPHVLVQKFRTTTFP